MDRNKVIKGLTCCKTGAQDSVHDGALRACNKCPYAGDYPCTSRLAADALELINEQPVLVHCSECIHCGKSDAPGFWYCKAWDEDVSMDMWNPDEYYCAEGEKRELSADAE